MDRDEGYKILNPISKKAMYIANIIYSAIIAALAIAVFYTANIGMISIYYGYAAIAVLAICLVYFAISPSIFYKHYRYIVNSEKVDVRKGIIIIRRYMVPIERVHQVKITRGPINNMFGLADVQVMTAGGVAMIQFLEIDEAESIADELNKLINSIVRDRKKDD